MSAAVEALTKAVAANTVAVNDAVAQMKSAPPDETVAIQAAADQVTANNAALEGVLTKPASP